MSTMVSYKIGYVHPKFTIVREYWDDLLVKSYRVLRQYTGGDVLEFIDSNEHHCMPHFEALQEYERRMSILNV